MYAHQIMARKVLSTTPDSTILDAANIMLQHRVSGLPVVDRDGTLVGIITEGDFLHRSEIGTERKRNWLATSYSDRKMGRGLRIRAWTQGIGDHDTRAGHRA